MPSPLELLSRSDDSPPPGPPPDGLLRSVKAEGGRRRSGRRRRNLALAVVALALVAVPAVALRPGSGRSGQEINVATGGGAELVGEADPTSIDATAVIGPGDPPTTLPADGLAATLPPASPSPPPVVSSAAPPPAAATAAAPSIPPPTPVPTTTARVCRNSDDPACGDFRWDPPPAPNQPLVASFTKAPPKTAVAGQTVVFEVTWSDGDAALTFDRLSTDGTALNTACSLAPRYGPWTPPAAAPSSGTLPYTTSFPNPGTYTISVSLGTADCTSPYGSDTLLTTNITVEAAPAPG